MMPQPARALRLGANLTRYAASYRKDSTDNGIVKVKKSGCVDRHRHMYQSGVKSKSTREGVVRKVPIERREAARLILKVLTRLSQAWKREPQKLPGWRDSLC